MRFFSIPDDQASHCPSNRRAANTIIGALLALAFMIPGLALAQILPSQSPICGDCNIDSRVTVADTVMALHAASGSLPPGVTVDDRCDVDSNPGPSAGDGLLIAQFSAGLLSTLTCTGQATMTPAAVEPTPVLDPFVGNFGSCVQGQSRGNGWSFSLFGNTGQQSANVAAVPNSSTSIALATAWVNAINNSPTITGYQAIPYSGNCFFVIDNMTSQPAVIQITSGGPACTPDITGTPCPFG